MSVAPHVRSLLTRPSLRGGESAPTTLLSAVAREMFGWARRSVTDSPLLGAAQPHVSADSIRSHFHRVTATPASMPQETSELESASSGSRQCPSSNPLSLLSQILPRPWRAAGSGLYQTGMSHGRIWGDQGREPQSTHACIARDQNTLWRKADCPASFTFPMALY